MREPQKRRASLHQCRRTGPSRVPTYTEEGIVLRRADWSEYDRIITVLTRGRGKVALVARGVRRPQSRLASHLDLFTHVDLVLASGRGTMDVITGARARSRLEANFELERATTAAVCAEVLDALVDPGVADPGLFDLALLAFTDCGAAPEPVKGLLWFLIRFAVRSGYAPLVHECAACGVLLEADDGGFSGRLGGVVCPSCASSGHFLSLSLRSLKVLRVICRDEREVFGRVALPRQEQLQLLAAATDLLGYQGEHHFRSVPVLEGLLQ